MSFPKIAQHVISLARTPERLQQFARANPHLESVSVFAGVDGAAIDRTDPALRDLVADDCSYNTGAIGCALSHLRLWEECIATNAPITIFEDDAFTHPSFDAQLLRLRHALPADWDIVLWGYNVTSVMAAIPAPGLPTARCMFEPHATLDLATYQASNFHAMLLKLIRTYGICGYSLSPKGAAILKRESFPLRKRICDIPELDKRLYEYGIDMAMANCYPHMNAHAAFPPLVVSTSEYGGSTIQPGQAGKREPA